MFFKQGSYDARESHKGTVGNAIREAFLLHARVLQEFLYPPSRVNVDSVLASDFSARWDSERPTQPDSLRKPRPLRDRFNALVAHLSYRRDREYLKRIRGDGKTLMEDMKVCLRKFSQIAASDDATNLSARFQKAVAKHCTHSR